MKIAVVAANGRAAQKVVREALDRGFEVKAFGRGAENRTAASDYAQKDIMDLTKEETCNICIDKHRVRGYITSGRTNQCRLQASLR